MEGFEQLAGKRKDFTSLHVEQVFSLREKEIGRYICFPQHLRGHPAVWRDSAGKDRNAGGTGVYRVFF